MLSGSLSHMSKRKNPAAVKLGRRGGLARARNAAKSPKKRKRLSEIGRQGAAVRWKKGKKR
jgi:hypothetical protein